MFYQEKIFKPTIVIELKYNPELERMAIKWVNEVIGLDQQLTVSIADYLRDGTLLCRCGGVFFAAHVVLTKCCNAFFRLINSIQPNSVMKIHTGNVAFRKIVCLCQW